MVLFSYFRKRPYSYITVFTFIAFAPLSPIGITYQNIEGPQRIVGYCNIRTLGGMEAAIEMQRRGECIVASDLVSYFTLEEYLIW
jgi:hypothetical protein